MAGIDALRTLFEIIRDEKRTHANTAERIGNALLEILPYLGEFIRKDQPDSTRYLLTLLAGAVVGEGKITLNPDGSITCHSLHVDGSAIFDGWCLTTRTFSRVTHTSQTVPSLTR